LFDIFRAYGLAFAISGFKANPETQILDKGYAYYIDIIEGCTSKNPDPELFADTDNWINAFGKEKTRKDAKKKPTKAACEELLGKEYDKILSLYKQMDFFPRIGNAIKDGETLYQTIDISASKGFREEKCGVTYHDGSQLSVDKYSWVLACLGRVFFGAQINCGGRNKGYILTIVPNPYKVLLHEQRQLQRDLSLSGLCVFSPNGTLVHYAIKLYLLLSKSRHNIKYDNILFNSLRKTGQKPKPSGGGKYSLSLLERFSKSNGGSKILEELDRELELSSVKGFRQNIGFALTDFLLRPTLQNFRTYERLYILGQINESNQFSTWEKEQWEEIIKNVEVT
jgi:hypothetical protein